MFLQRLLENERDVLAQVRAGHEKKGVSENVVAALGNQFLDGHGNQRFAQFHEARFNVLVAEPLAHLLNELDHDLVALFEPRAVSEDEDTCFSPHRVIV